MGKGGIEKIVLYQIKASKDFKLIVKELNTNIRSWKYLGRGSYGSAYNMGNGLVCKITTSVAEINATKKLLRSKKRLKGLYKVINVYSLKYRGKIYGIIITPLYKQLTIKQQGELFNISLYLYMSKKYRLKSMSHLKNIIYNQIKRYHYCPALWNKKRSCQCASSVLNELLVRYMKVFHKYNIYGILRSLKAINLPATDIHYRNIVKDGNRFILIDLMT